MSNAAAASIIGQQQEQQQQQKQQQQHLSKKKSKNKRKTNKIVYDDNELQVKCNGDAKLSTDRNMSTANGSKDCCNNNSSINSNSNCNSNGRSKSNSNCLKNNIKKKPLVYTNGIALRTETACAANTTFNNDCQNGHAHGQHANDNATSGSSIADDDDDDDDEDEREDGVDANVSLKKNAINMCKIDLNQQQTKHETIVRTSNAATAKSKKSRQRGAQALQQEQQYCHKVNSNNNNAATAIHNIALKQQIEQQQILSNGLPISNGIAGEAINYCKKQYTVQEAAAMKTVADVIEESKQHLLKHCKKLRTNMVTQSDNNNDATNVIKSISTATTISRTAITTTEQQQQQYEFPIMREVTKGAVDGIATIENEATIALEKLEINGPEGRPSKTVLNEPTAAKTINTTNANASAVSSASKSTLQISNVASTDNTITSQTETPALCMSNIDIVYTEYESEHQMHDIMRLIQAELSEPYSIYTYRYFIYNWPKLCFLAAHGDEYVGAIVCKLDMHMHVRRGYIAMLAVRKEYRKLKIGTTLVQKAIEAMLADNADEVVLETEMRNLPALRLYENLGFVRDKRLFRYYLNGVDALRLKLWFR